MPNFAIFFHRSTKITKRFSGVSAPNITKFVGLHDVATFNALLSSHGHSDIPIRLEMAAQQRKKNVVKDVDFVTFVGCHGNVSEILVRVHSVVLEID